MTLKIKTQVVSSRADEGMVVHTVELSVAYEARDGRQIRASAQGDVWLAPASYDGRLAALEGAGGRAGWISAALNALITDVETECGHDAAREICDALETNRQ
jgi:hypothetical protein